MQNNLEIESIALIGAGNVGWHLSIALYRAGFRINYIVSRVNENSSKLAGIIQADVIPSIQHIKTLPDLFLVCVQDSKIEDVMKSLGETDSMVLHTSGSIGMDVFSGKKGGCGVFYPLQTFTLGREMSYSGIPFLLEADGDTPMRVMQTLAGRISGVFLPADSSTRRQMHLSAVFACNFSNHMAAIANRLLKREDIDPALLRPLMAETYRKLEEMDPQKSQTGPAVRDDTETMRSHLDLMAGDPEWKELYELISRDIKRIHDIK